MSEILRLAEALETHAAALIKLAEVGASIPGARPAVATAGAEAPGRPRPAAGTKPGDTAPTEAPRRPERPGAAAPANGADAAPIKYDQVRELVLTLAEKKGHQAAVTLLGKYNAKNGKDLKAADYPAVVHEINMLLEASPAIA